MIKKIHEDDLRRLAVEQGLGCTEIARQLDVTKGAVSRRLKTLRLNKVRDVTIRHAADMVENQLDTVLQLQKINSYANELLDLLMKWNRGDDVALQVLESQFARKKVKIGKTFKFVEQLKIKDPRELALNAMREIRGQIGLQFDILQSLCDMTAVAEFQKEVLDAIAEVSPDVKERIIERLKKGRFVRGPFDLHRFGVSGEREEAPDPPVGTEAEPRGEALPS